MVTDRRDNGRLTAPEYRVGCEVYRQHEGEVTLAGKKSARIAKAQLKRIIPTALRPAEFDNFHRAERANHPKLQRMEDAASELIASSLEAAGLDFSKLEALGERHDKALQRVLETQKKDALKRTPKVARTLYAAVDARVGAVRDLSDGQALVPPPGALHRPFLIWAGKHSSKVLIDSQIIADKSWAKIRYIPSQPPSTAPKPDTEPRRLSFWFTWQNPNDYYTVVRASSYLVLSGHVSAYASGGRRIQIRPATRDRDAEYRYIPPGYAYGGVAPSFTAWQWWNQPPVEMPMNYQYGIELEVKGGTYSSVADSRFVSQSYGFEAEMNLVTVPPQATVVFEVAVELVSNVRRGSVDLDFASGDWRITCPFVLVEVLTGPPPP